MSQRSGELLLKAIRTLPPEEQEEVLVALLGEAPFGLAAPMTQPLPWSGVGVTAMPEQVMVTGPPRPGGSFQIPIPPDVLMPQPLTVLGTPPGREDPELRVLPVRLPVADYERLRRWSREHDFSMAVIIRTLVERFMESQDPNPPDSPERRPRKTKRKPDAKPATS